MGIKHDLALLNVTVLLEQASNLLLRKTWMNTSNEEIGTWVDSTIIASWSSSIASIALWSATVAFVRMCMLWEEAM